MKGWKKCTVFLLALVICLSLAACGVGSSKGESEDYAQALERMTGMKVKEKITIPPV